MKWLVRWLLGVPTLIVLLLFALANRHMVRVSFDPVSVDDPLLSVHAPLWAVLFAGILLGLIAGGVATWLKQGKWRRQARDYEYKLAVTENELKRQQKAGENAAGAASASAPALPSS